MPNSDLSPYQKIIKADEDCELLELSMDEVAILARDPHIKATCQRQCDEFARTLIGMLDDGEDWP